MTVAADLAILRAILADYQDVISGPDVRLGMDAAGRVDAEIARLGEERDTLEKLLKEEQQTTDDSATQRYRAEAAEAEAARLRDGLRHYRLAHGTRCTCSACDTARALLSEDGAA